MIMTQGGIYARYQLKAKPALERAVTRQILHLPHIHPEAVGRIATGSPDRWNRSGSGYLLVKEHTSFEDAWQAFDRHVSFFSYFERTFVLKLVINYGN